MTEKDDPGWENPEEFDSSAGFDPREWVSNWSYEKIHAVGIGAAFTGLAAVSNSPTILSAYLAILLWAFGIRSSPRRDTRTGDKKEDESPDPEDEIAERSRDNQSTGLSAKLLAEIRHKPHYFFAGGIGGDRIGYTIHYYLYGVAPDHYEHIPDLVQFLVGF